MPLRADGTWPPPTPAELAAMAEQTQEVPAVDARGLVELSHDKPLRLRRLMEDWPARQWNREHFLTVTGDLRCRVRPCANLHEYGYPGPSSARLTVRDYFSQGPSTISSTVSGGVIFENDFHAAHSALAQGYSVPRLLSRVHGRPIFSAGRQHTGVGFHCHTESWLAQLQGRKAWFLVPDDYDRPQSLPPWWYLRERPQGCLFCVLEPGEILFVPDYWWHSTWNLDEFTVAVGWECGASSNWNKDMHLVADGDVSILARLGSGEDLRITPEMMQLAARRGHIELLRGLLDFAGGQALLGPDSAVPVAVAAARSGHIAVLQLLEDQGCNGTEILATEGRNTPLHEAACCGQEEVVIWLLEHGADARCLDGAGLEPLHLAVLHGQASIVEALVAAAADVDAAHARGSTPLMQAAFNGHVGVAEVLLHAGASSARQDQWSMGAVHVAAMRGHVAFVEFLFAAAPHVDVNAPEHQGCTPLHLAARGYTGSGPSSVPDVGFPSGPDANLTMVKCLLAAAADPTVCDVFGCTALNVAAAAGHERTARLLSRASAGGT